jgi:hypothetical protein
MMCPIVRETKDIKPTKTQSNQWDADDSRKPDHGTIIRRHHDAATSKFLNFGLMASEWLRAHRFNRGSRGDEALIYTVLNSS